MGKFRNFMKTAVIAGAMACSAISLSAGSVSAGNERLMDVLDRGVVRIGVQGAFKPWSYRRADGDLEGIEVDLANDVAEALGVELELVVIKSSNRMEFLQQGKIDIIIGAMSDKPDRRRIVGIVEPAYWSSGMTLMAKDGVLSGWDDISGKPVCGKQGTWYNKVAEKDYGAKVIAFSGNTEAKEALRSGKCVAWVYDSSSIDSDLASGEWDGYVQAAPTVSEIPWGAAVPIEERDSTFGRFLSGMTYSWHESGRLLELEEKWGVSPSGWLKSMSESLSYDNSYLN